MAKTGRNDPCPCGSGKKYKKCCLHLHESSQRERHGNAAPSIGPFVAAFDELDKLSNSVLDLIKEGRLDEAENVCHQLLTRYPDQIDGLDRLAHLYEARGQNKKAAEYHRKAAAFAQSNPGFDQEAIEWYLSKATQLESEQ
jgi:tetratricopeptide (TPR) repeat protein